MTGLFVISLDLELQWGVCDRPDLESYRDNILGVRQAVPAMLDLFESHGVKATWATVGLLFYEERAALEAGLPGRRPGYADSTLSSYSYLSRVGQNEHDDPLHFGASLIRKILERPEQEVATHTFSHYYCLERGQDVADFEADIVAAVKAARQWDIELKSIVFPRNQVNPAYLPVLSKHGMTSYRGNPAAWMYRERNSTEENLLRRGARLIDTYLPVADTVARPRQAGKQVSPLAHSLPVNIPASRFLRPFQPALSNLEPLRLSRIKAEMTRAARRGELYHLWWHPHNFGVHLSENLRFLDQILRHFNALRREEGMESLTMAQVAEQWTRRKSLHAPAL
jgi:peptidoglycan/xylan/chitin deacetylase (PgdA/CDA1 family)